MAATRKLTVEILGDAKGAMGAFGTIQKGTSNLGEQFVAFGKKAALAFAGIAVGAIAIGKSAVSAASDLNENLSKTEVVFGDAAKAVIDFSKTTAKSMGQSQNQTLQAAGNFGIFGKSAGLAGKDLSKFTIDLVGLASDMASFSNTTPQEAVDALGAALRGESEPIRKYGVLLNDASLKAKAMEMGIYDGNGALTAQQKILASHALIFEQTTDAQGDFARTSDGLANQQRILSARFEDIKTKLGAFLLPIVLDVVSAFGDFVDKVSPFVEKYGPKLAEILGDVYEKAKNLAKEIAEKLQPTFEKVVNWMKENTGTVKVFFGVIAGAAVVASLLALASSIAALFNPIVLAIGAVALIAAGFYYAYQNSEEFRDKVDAVVAWVRDTAIPWLIEAYQKFKDKLDEFEVKFKEVHENVTAILEKYVAAVKIYLEILSTLWQIFGDNLMSYLERVFGNIYSIVVNVLNGIYGWIQIFAGLLTGDWSKMWEGMKTVVSSAFENIKSVVMLAAAPIIAAFGGLFTAFKSVFGSMVSTAGEVVGSIVGKFTEGFSKLREIARSIFSGIVNIIKSLVSGVINFFIGAINKLIGVINTAIRAYNRIPLAPDIGEISKIPSVALAKGGIVTGPTIALVGEAGPEMVVPLTGPYVPDFMQADKSGDTYIQIRVDAGLVSSPDQVGAQIIDAIRRAERRSGQVFATA